VRPVSSQNIRSSSARKDFLFVQSTTELGGAETVLLNLFTASEELRRRSLIVSMGYGGGDLPDRLAAVGAEVVRLKTPRLRYVWRLVPSFQQLVAVARQAGVQAIVGNGTHPQVIAALAARLAGVKSVFLVHAIFREPLFKNDAREILALTQRCHLVLAVSKAARETMGRLRPSVPNRLLHNGTPLREVAPAEAEAARAELGAREGDTLIGVFGRLQRWKGQDVFIEAARRIARDRPRTRFVIVGGSEIGFEPDYLDEIRRAAAAPELGDRVIFTGFRNDVARLMAACDVVCHTSRVPEPFGLVLIEAMALGRPVIATAGGGPSEIISSPAEGILIPPDDSGALARALTELVDDPERRRVLGAGGRKRVRSQFSIDVMAATMLRYLDEMLAA
jgi:glycosyltransferase involved in cell wall biosynthesis